MSKTEKYDIRALMKLPVNPHIAECFSISEIAEKMNSGDYSAEMLLQHLALHWNRGTEAWPLPKRCDFPDGSTQRRFSGEHCSVAELAATCRQKWHDMLDRAMDETTEGDFFLPQFVRLILLDNAKG